MGGIKAKWDKDTKVLYRAFDSLLKTAGENQKIATIEATLLLHEEAVKGLQPKGSDRQTRYKPKRVVTVSPVGEPPNTDKGRAVQSINYEFAYTKDTYIGRVGTNLKYLMWLEFGTKNVGARPWLSTAYNKVEGKIKDIFRKYADKTVEQVEK